MSAILLLTISTLQEMNTVIVNKFPRRGNKLTLRK